MPVIHFTSYRKQIDFLKNGHYETIIPSIFRRIRGVKYKREKIETPDDDFLNLDWIKSGNEVLVILSHGLEGNTNRHYMKSCAKYFSENGFDVLAWNYRTCGGEMNRTFRLYHHGVTDDLETVVNHAIDTRDYKKIALVGFSMGGSTTLKYLGENGPNVPKHVVAAATFSVPCNLWDSAHQLTSWGNAFYRKRFLRRMITKLKKKHEQYPDRIDLKGIDKLVSFGQFDELYTAPIHGFRNGRHFYKTMTSDLHYHSIKVPSLIVNAQNDPLLGEKCYPYEVCKKHKFLHLETPECGGHVGFSLFNENHSWMDVRALEFVSKYTEL